MSDIQCKIQIHFDGDITDNHQIPVRILGKGLVHFQRAFDRAHLDGKFENGVFKYARMADDDYIKNELWVDVPQDGGYIANLFSRNKKNKKTADRVSHAIEQVITTAEEPYSPIKLQVEGRKNQLSRGDIQPISFNNFHATDDENITRDFGDRSISKEIDEILSIIRAKHAGDSSVELKITGTMTKTFDFDRPKSVRFHKAVSKKSIGKPVLYKGTLQSLDKKNKSGKFTNSENNRTSMVRVTNDDDFLKIHPYLGDIGEIEFIGCPLIEFGSLEPNSGDIYFLSLHSEYNHSPGNIRVE